MAEKKLIVIAGPTAVGKTTVAIRIAEALHTEIVSADSRQVFREMTIGTAKPTADEMRRVKHYFVDILSVNEEYDAARYATEAVNFIEERLQAKGQLVLCGGSGLYIKGVCDGFDNMPDVPAEVREQLTQGYLERGLEWLQKQLQALDPQTYQVIDQKNPHRLIRALEVKMHSGESILTFRKNRRQERNFQIVKIGLELPRQELYARIDERMDGMIAAGLFEEAKELYSLRHKQALQTVGYQEVFSYLENAYDRDECVRLLKRNSRRYAKRQLTWFKKDPEFTWFHPAQISDMLQYIQAN